MSEFITATFWIRCAFCNHQVCITDIADPAKDVRPETLTGAWCLAIGVGWRGGFEKPKCPDCVKASE